MNEYADFFSGKKGLWELPYLSKAFLFHVVALDHVHGVGLRMHARPSMGLHGEVLPSGFVKRMREGRNTFVVPLQDHFIIAMNAKMTAATLDHSSYGMHTADVNFDFDVVKVFSFHFTTRFDTGHPMTRPFFPNAIGLSLALVEAPLMAWADVWPLYKPAWELERLLEAFCHPEKTLERADGCTCYDLMRPRDGD